DQPARLGRAWSGRGGRHRHPARVLPQPVPVAPAVGTRGDVLRRRLPRRAAVGDAAPEVGVNGGPAGARVELPAKPRDTFRLVASLALVALFGWSSWSLDLKWRRLVDAPADMARLARAMYREPAWDQLDE